MYKHWSKERGPRRDVEYTELLGQKIEEKKFQPAYNDSYVAGFENSYRAPKSATKVYKKELDN